jgi:hypothetical protein
MTVSRVIGFASVCTVLMALAGGGLTLVAARRLSVALAVFLDLLTASGLLHLAASPTLRSATFAGIILVVRRVVGWGLRASAIGPAQFVPRIGATARRYSAAQYSARRRHVRSFPAKDQPGGPPTDSP